jgi:hypothetical protein
MPECSGLFSHFVARCRSLCSLRPRRRPLEIVSLITNILLHRSNSTNRLLQSAPFNFKAGPAVNFPGYSEDELVSHDLSWFLEFQANEKFLKYFPHAGESHRFHGCYGRWKISGNCSRTPDLLQLWTERPGGPSRSESQPRVPGLSPSSKGWFRSWRCGGQMNTDSLV